MDKNNKYSNWEHKYQVEDIEHLEKGYIYSNADYVVGQVVNGLKILKKEY